MAGFSQFSVSARAEIPPERLEKAEPFLKAVAPLDADRLLPHTAPAILFQFADFDQFITHDEAQRSVQPASRRWSSVMKARTSWQIRAPSPTAPTFSISRSLSARCAQSS